MGVMSGIH